MWWLTRNQVTMYKLNCTPLDVQFLQTVVNAHLQFPCLLLSSSESNITKALKIMSDPFRHIQFFFSSVSLPFDLLSWNNTPLGKTKLFLEGSEIMCVLYHYIKVSLTWESEVCWLSNKKKSSNFTKTSYTKLKSLLTWSYQSSLHNYRRIKYL